MKVFIVLLALGLVSCHEENYSAGVENPVGCAKEDTTPFINPLLGPSITTPATSFMNDVPSVSANICADDFPPAVSAPSNIGDEGSFPSTLSSSDLPDSYQPGKLTYSSIPALCARHHIVRSLRPVIEERVQNVPVIQNYLRNRPVTVTKNVPVITNKVLKREENKIRHVPVVRKYICHVIDKMTDLVPVVRRRVVPVVQRYTQHVPVRKCYNRPVVDEDQSCVPVVYARYIPVIKQRTDLVPVTEKRYRPVIESSVVQVPVKQKIIRNLVERKVQKQWEHCQCCNSPFNSAYTSDFLPNVYSSPRNIYPSENYNTYPLSAPSAPALWSKDNIAPSDCSCLY